MTTVIDTTGIARADWLELRRTHITATDVAQAATGYYGTLRTVVEDKLTPPDDDGPTDAMARGLAAETPLVLAVEALTGLHVINRQLFAHQPDRPEWACTLDGELAASPDGPPLAVLETKTRNQRVPVPAPYYRVQVEWQMLIRGLDVGLIARGDYTDDTPDGSEVLVGLRLQRVETDPGLRAQLIEVADRIWSYLQAGQLPPVDGSEKVAERIAARFPRADTDAEALDVTDLEELLDQRRTVIADLAVLEAEKRRLDSLVKERLGTTPKATTAGGWRISWPNRRALDLDQLRADGHADLIAKHTRTEETVDLTALAADLGKKTADRYRTVHTGRAGLTITPPKENP